MSVDYTQLGNAAIITLNRPKFLNTLTYEMIEKIERYLKNINKNKNIKLVIFKGEGEKAFCAGGDVKGFYQEKFSNINKLRKEFFYKEYKINYLIKKYKKPIISFINGICMGGGVGIALHSKIVIVSEKVVFAMPETALGLFPDVGAGNILSKLDDNIGIYLGLTGKRLCSADLIQLGLAKYCVNINNFNTLQNLLVNATNIRSINKIINQYTIETNSILFPSLNKEIYKVFKHNKVEKIISLLQNSNQKWAQEALGTIQNNSPTSLKITLKQIRLAKHKSFKDDLIMEYRMSQACMAGGDFYEGVRSILIDKDHKPKWKPNKIEDVDSKLVMAHFKPLGNDDLKFK